MLNPILTTTRPVLFAVLLALLCTVSAPSAAAGEPADSCLLLYGVYHKNPHSWPPRSAFLRYCVSQSQWTVQKGDVLEYDILIPKENAGKSGGVDLRGEKPDGIDLRTCKAVDQNGIPADPAATLEPAVGKWYARKIPLDGMAGRTIWQAAIVFDSHRVSEYGVHEPEAEYLLFVDNIRIRHADGGVTAIYENGAAPFVPGRLTTIAGTRPVTIYENGTVSLGPMFSRAHYAGYPVLLSIPREGIKAGQSAEGFFKQAREQSLRQRRAQKLALEFHIIKTWIESGKDRTAGEEYGRIPYIKAWSDSDRNLGLEKELGDMSGSVEKLFDLGLSGEAFEAGLKNVEIALADLSKTAAARLRERLAGLESQQPNLIVDFGRELGPVTYRASGFLHGFSPDEPPDDVIAPLKPQALRSRSYTDYGILATYERAKRLGVKHVSAVIGCIVTDRGLIPLPGLKDNDWSPWEDQVEQMVKDVRNKKWQVEWDVWNEPNGTFVGHSKWQGKKTEEEQMALWKETWKRAVMKIRSLDPQAVIIGPSTSGYAEKFIKDFLLYAKDQKVLPDQLSWHEYSGGPNIVAHAQTMREFMKAAAIPELPICINEYCGPNEQFHPGAKVNYFAGLERASVISANSACWSDECCSNCEELMLNGLVNQPEKDPRSIWWTYKAYAEITGTLVDVQTTMWWWNAVAGYDAARRQARMLLGRYHGDIALPFSPCIVRFIGMDKLAGIVKNNKVHVTGAWIPNTETKPLLRPLATLDGEYEVKDNAVTVVVPNIGQVDAYTLTLGDPDGRE